jgi:hypothetical protein
MQPAPAHGLAPWPQANGHFIPVDGGFAEQAKGMAQQIARVLAPGGRLVTTRALRRGTNPA